MTGDSTKSAIFITVRMKSTRLPNKALLKIENRPAIEHLIERLKLAKLPDLIVLCTSTHPDDAILVDVARQNHIEYFRGSEDDKLDRYLNAAQKYGVDFIVVTEGDNIFYEPEIIDEIIKLYLRTKADYITCRGLPLGTSPHGINVGALNKVCQIKSETDTEVWRGYFTDTGLFKVEYLEVEEELRHPEIRMTLDYPEDYEFFKEIFDRLYVPGKVFSLRDIIALLKSNPQLMDINRNVQEAYLKYLKKSAPVKLKDSPGVNS
ncbi:8-amino-3,8-dideoxy-manno-octulosonate cytidylyltransferase [subsurface metagenome]